MNILELLEIRATELKFLDSIKSDKVVSSHINSMTQNKGGDILEFSDFIEEHFFTIDNSTLVFGRSIPQIIDYRNKCGLESVVNQQHIQSYMDAGVILPPFTVYSNIFRVPIFSTLRHQDGLFLLWCSPSFLNKPHPFVKTHELSDELAESLLRSDLIKQDNELICTISGGADSSALLSVLCKVVDPKKVIALCCRMPGYDGEIERARKVAESCGVRFIVYEPDSVLDERIVRNYIETHGDLVYDPVVPVIASMFNDYQNNQTSGEGELIIVEGQGADTVLTGLPHDLVISLYLPIFSPFFRLLRSILPPPSENLRRRCRFCYRLNKTIQMLGESNWRHALLRSLDFERKNYPHLYDMMDNFLVNYINQTGDRHKAIMLFFFNILQVREMQKYRVMNSKIRPMLPFLDLNFIKRCYVTPTSFFFQLGRRKIPIIKYVRKQFPGLFKSSSTTPFAVEYELTGSESIRNEDGNTYNKLKNYSISVLKKNKKLS